MLEEALTKHVNEPAAYLALAQMYADVSRGPQAVKLLQDAQAKFPASTAIVFELGATFEKQKDFAGAETAFRQVLAREPEHAAALNYLGYMLAERGERLDESVEYLKRALAIEPDNGSFLDSLGWAYFKAGKLDLAEENLRRAAEQLRANSVDPGALRPAALQDGPVRRGHLGVEPRARRRWLVDRPRRHRPGRSATPDKNSTVNEAGAGGSGDVRRVRRRGLAAAACSPPLMKLPSGTATPASPAEARRRARADDGGVRVRPHVQLESWRSVARPAGGASAAGCLPASRCPRRSVSRRWRHSAQPLFFFVATGDDATLLLPRDDRVLEHGRPDAVLEAVAGVPLGAADLATTLTGCAPASTPTGRRRTVRR